MAEPTITEIEADVLRSILLSALGDIVKYDIPDSLDCNYLDLVVGHRINVFYTRSRCIIIKDGRLFFNTFYSLTERGFIGRNWKANINNCWLTNKRLGAVKFIKQQHGEDTRNPPR